MLRALGRLHCAAVGALVLIAAAAPSAAQCPSHGEGPFFGGHGYDGDEPDDFTHYLDADGDGLCDVSGDANGNAVCDEPSCTARVGWDAARGVHPNGVYPDCMQVLYVEGTPNARFLLQLGHGHWEYTRLQSDTSGAPEEKDYATVSQAMLADLQAGDTSGTATRAAIDQTLRFLTGEPIRFERFLLTNPAGRYWQVDQWIGPALPLPAPLPGLGGLTKLTAPLPLLTWTERFFVCGDANGVRDCAFVNGVSAYGGYWSDHSEQLGYAAECGDGELDDPEPELAEPRDPDRRSAACGMLFVECSE